MNEDAEAWIDGQLPNSLEAEMMRQAMRWAYADAASICQHVSSAEECAQCRDGMFAAERCLRDIEERAK